MAIEIKSLDAKKTKKPNHFKGRDTVNQFQPGTPVARILID